MSRAYPDRPHIGVGIVVFKGDDVLLVRRTAPPLKGDWSIPGGAQELGESVRQAAMRELYEETGVSAEILGLVDVVDTINRDENGRVQFHYTLVDFAAEWSAGDPVAGEDVGEAIWVPVDRLGDYGLWLETLRIIEMAQHLRRRV